MPASLVRMVGSRVGIPAILAPPRTRHSLPRSASATLPPGLPGLRQPRSGPRGGHHLTEKRTIRTTTHPLSEIPPGHVRTWFAPDVGDALAELASTLGHHLDTPLLAIDWPAGTDPGAAIDRIVEALAGVAAARWPDWYGERAPFAHPDMGEGVASDYDDRVIDRLGAAHTSLNRAWAKRAIRRCRRGQRPVLNAFPPAVQVPQLMLALAQPDLILLLALEATDARPAEILGFARAAAWAAGQTGARAAAFVPAAYRESPELDAISYGAVSWTRAEDSPSPHAAPREDPGMATQDTVGAGRAGVTRVRPGLRNAGTQCDSLPGGEIPGRPAHRLPVPHHAAPRGAPLGVLRREPDRPSGGVQRWNHCFLLRLGALCCSRSRAAWRSSPAA